MADMPKHGYQHQSGQHQCGQHDAASRQKQRDEKRPKPVAEQPPAEVTLVDRNDARSRRGCCPTRLRLALLTVSLAEVIDLEWGRHSMQGESERTMSAAVRIPSVKNSRGVAAHHTP